MAGIQRRLGQAHVGIHHLVLGFERDERSSETDEIHDVELRGRFSGNPSPMRSWEGSTPTQTVERGIPWAVAEEILVRGYAEECKSTR